MNILNFFSKEELELLNNINLTIEDREYEEIEVKKLAKNIYNKGYMNTNITYAEAEKYRQIYERVECIAKVDLEKVKKYSREEFENEYYMCTVMMHEAVWNNPNRINQMKKNKNEDPLSEEERQRYQKKFEENSAKLLDYTKYLEEKYGGELFMIERYYSTIAKGD